jgi:flagellin
MVITSNVEAITAGRALSSANTAAATASERLSTGLRLNSAADDPSSMGVAARFKARIASYSKAIENINNGIAMVQTADTALSAISTVLTSMRTLAVSSANGATSAASRTDNQTTLDEYRDEIDALANNAKWNGSSLLNGAITKVLIQSGIDQGATTQLSFSSALSSALGKGDTLSLSAFGATTTAMASGDLVINGYTIGATSTSDDSLSYSAKDGSAIARVAAINQLTSSTNVQAKVGTTTVSGSSMSALANTSGTVTINGVAIAMTLSATATMDVNRATVVSSINAVSGQTGVTATDGGDTTKGVILTASDGRNITLAKTTLTSSDTGLAADGTYAGSYTLRSLSGDSMTLTTTTGNIANADLREGTYAGNTAQVSTTARAGSTAAPVSLTSNDLLINGYSIGAAFSSDDTATAETTTSSTKASSAIATAAAINRQTATTGVTAVANANQLMGTSFTAGNVTSIFLNGVTIAASLSASSSRSDVVSLLNTYTGQKGVVASDNGAGLTLSASDGRNISLGVSDSSGAVTSARIGLGGTRAFTAAAGTGTAQTFISTVRLTSDKLFTIAPGSAGTSNFTTLGFRAGTFGGLSDDQKLTTLDISSQTGGTNALTVIDGAIDLVSRMRATAGAQQTRLSAQSSLNSAMNTATTSAYSKVAGADMAQEATNLATAQMLASSATAMLAQANMSKEIVSYLLKRYVG